MEQVAVLGVPDERWGEVGLAVIVPRGDALDAEVILAWCRARLAKFKVSRRIALVDALPQNASGKVEKATLRARYR